MVQRIIVWIIKFSPSSKRWFWKFWYNLFARKSGFHAFRFMNYGYDEDGCCLDLLEEDEAERYSIQLYHHTATQVDISNQNLLEVGSGRGGGSSYVQRYLKTRTVTGLDISSDAVQLSNSSFNIPGLSFVQGDSESLPFENNTFDVVLNVESSHCYGDIEKFLFEVARILKDSGCLLWTDFRTNQEMKNLFLLFKESGFVVEREKDITQNIIRALELLTPYRKRQIKKHVPSVIQGVFQSYAGVAGGSVNKAFLEGNLIYKSATLRINKG
tara:strand:+ start:219 stop:1028 length:810 start_codon:yes stop_codon:yes gene_type:complete